MRKVLWSIDASRDLDELMSWIAEDNEQNANRVGGRIERTAKNLGSFAAGRFGRVVNTYEITVQRTPYVIAYHKTDTAIVILRVIHGARDWQPGGWPRE